MEQIFGSHGRLSKVWPHFEFRSGQMKMARMISQAIKMRKNLLVEAGTGIGKTLAYLLPAIESQNHFIISTGTKNLQDQIFHKDLPFIKKKLGYAVQACYMKGRENYLCLRRYKEFASQPLLKELEEATIFHSVQIWAERTKTGDRSELMDVPEYFSFWRDMNARSDTCMGKKCASYHQCFLTRLKNKALKSQLVIVNHHLFFADLSIRNDFGAIIPPYKYLIFDEAHMIEEIATPFFGISISRKQWDDFIREAGRLLSSRKSKDLQKKFSSSLKESLDQFFCLFLREEGRYRLKETEKTSLLQKVEHLSHEMDWFLKKIQREVVDLERWNHLLRRGIEMIGALQFFARQEEEAFAYYYEVKGQNVTLHAAPIDVSGILRERLFKRIHCAILTSATLTVGRSFSFIKDRLGLDHPIEFIAESPFHFRRQAILYLPSRIPPPQDVDFLPYMARDLQKLLHISRGRAFILFTSIAHMKKLYEMMAPKLPYPLFIQGELEKAILLEKFRSSKGAVLFATASFWQGVDVQGEMLSLVSIDKLPFDVPTDPLIFARTEYLKKEGKNPFYSYQLPLAAIELKQGFGRLIRSKRDRGILALFDSRILQRTYGEIILKSLPPFQITDNLKDVERFFNKKN